jgi:succinate dehydrogenase / fumarate reductase flavoprotein subunit
MSTIPGLFVAGEANFSDHGANRLGASALMQGLADGYFVLPNTIATTSPRARRSPSSMTPDEAVAEASGASVEERTQRLLAINGERSVDSFHKELGNIMWEYCGMERTEDGLRKAIDRIRSLREEFWRNVRVLGSAEELNQSLEKAGPRGRLPRARRAHVHRRAAPRESCGGHFREESQTEDGEALRHDDQFLYVAAGSGAPETTTPTSRESRWALRCCTRKISSTTPSSSSSAPTSSPPRDESKRT